MCPSRPDPIDRDQEDDTEYRFGARSLLSAARRFSGQWSYHIGTSVRLRLHCRRRPSRNSAARSALQERSGCIADRNSPAWHNEVAQRGFPSVTYAQKLVASTTRRYKQHVALIREARFRISFCRGTASSIQFRGPS